MLLYILLVIFVIITVLIITVLFHGKNGSGPDDDIPPDEVEFIISEKQSKFENPKLSVKEILKTEDFSKIFLKDTSLLSILNNTRQIGVNVYNCGRFKLVFILGFNDDTLVKLGSDYGFPRGFPIIICPDKSCIVSGFYPKFNNDDRNGEISQVDGNATCNVKVSGSLCGVLPFKYEGRYYCITVAKNSFDNFHANIMHEFVQAKYTNDQLKFLADNNIFLYGEFISIQDMSHGQRPICDNLIITAVGKRDDKFFSFMPLAEMVKFCIENNFSVMSVYNIPIAVLRGIDRDHFSSLQLADFDQYTIIKGNIEHDNIYTTGPVEGLILRINGETVKFKFPMYTIRTMLLRAILKKVKEGNMTIDEDMNSEVNIFCKRWCFTEEGRKYWWCFAMTAIGLFRNGLEIDDSAHILAAEMVQNMELVPFENIDHGNIHIFILLGAVGSGKSSLMRSLVEKNTHSAAIDGDFIYGQNAKNFGSNRNEATISAVIAAIVSGKTPIISTGGGAIQGIKNILEEIFGMNIITHQIYLSSHVKEVVPFSRDHIDGVLPGLPDIIKRRVKSGEWTLQKGRSVENLTGEIAGRTKDNYKFVQDSGISVPIVVDGIVPDYGIEVPKNDPIKSVNVKQARILIKYDDNFYHITYSFNKLLKAADIIELQKYPIGQLKGNFYVLSNGTTFIAPDIKFLPKSHITVSFKAPQKAVDTGKFAEGIINSEDKYMKLINSKEEVQFESLGPYFVK
jgi:hypothetical protein